MFRYMRGRGISREDAEDIRQTVFEKIAVNLHTYDSARAGYGTWIYAITRNCVMDFYRKNKIQSVELQDYEMPDYETPEAKALDREDLTELAASLEKLSERERDIVILRYYKEMDMRVIAKSLGVSYGNARMILTRALRHLREIMDEAQGAP